MCECVCVCGCVWVLTQSHTKWIEYNWAGKTINLQAKDHFIWTCTFGGLSKHSLDLSGRLHFFHSSSFVWIHWNCFSRIIPKELIVDCGHWTHFSNTIRISDWEIFPISLLSAAQSKFRFHLSTHELVVKTTESFHCKLNNANMVAYFFVSFFGEFNVFQ